MKKGWIAILFGLALASPLYAKDLSSDLGFLAHAKDVFPPLVADPREIHMGMRVVMPVGHSVKGEIEAGEYFGLYRWALPWKDSYIQWSIAGGVFSRFELDTEQKGNEVNDYSANMPVDLRFGSWSVRLLPYHISSHLGDDYIRRTGIVPQKYTFDSFKTLLAYDFGKPWRLYGGYNYIIRNDSAYRGRSALQAGLEGASRWLAKGHAQLYWANDFQSWERTAWNPDFVTQLGVRLARHPEARQRLAIYSEYGSGHMSYGQFYESHESHWAFGIKLELP